MKKPDEIGQMPMPSGFSRLQRLLKTSVKHSKNEVFSAHQWHTWGTLAHLSPTNDTPKKGASDYSEASFLRCSSTQNLTIFFVQSEGHLFSPSQSWTVLNGIPDQSANFCCDKEVCSRRAFIQFSIIISSALWKVYRVKYRWTQQRWIKLMHR